MSFRFIPRSITALKQPISNTLLFNENYIKQIQYTLDSYDYTVKPQQTPIIYFGKSFQEIEQNNYYVIKNKFNSIFPNHKINFWKKDHPFEYIVTGGDKCLPNPDKLGGYDKIMTDYLVTRIWYNETDVDVLMEKGNFIYKYLIEINQPHRFSISDT